MQQRVLVCGGRDYSDRKRVYEILDVAHRANPIILLIAGGANGADALAVDWARGESVPHKVFNADWEKHGRAAGPIRNQQMLDEGRPHMVIAFPGGKGTANMVKLAGVASVAVVRVRPRS